MTPVGNNAEIDLFARLANIEAVVFNALNPLSVMFQGPAQSNVSALSGTTDAIPIKSGVVMVTGGAVDATTLALPIAGGPAVGGDDGKQLIIISTSAFAHTVTTPTGGFAGTKHIATFTAVVSNGFSTVAFNGLWYPFAFVGVSFT